MTTRTHIWIARLLGGVLLVALGAGLESLRAQRASTFDGTFRHIGFVVKDVDASARHFAQAFGATYSPIHAVVAPGPVPRGYDGDPKAGVRTTEIRTNGVEIHLLEPTGGKSPWRDGLERHGDGSVQHLSFGVKDLAGSVTALQKLGGQLTAGAGDGFFAYLEFPNLPFTVELEKVP
ncbi:MAG: VOC family protein [Vicinamibacterales bacterium]